MATKKAAAKPAKIFDRFDEDWDGVKMEVRDKNGKPIPANAAKKPAAKKPAKKK